MVEVKSVDDIARKYQAVTPGRASYYEQGISAPRKDWETETTKSEGAYAQGVNEAIADKRFSAGARKAGTGKWQKMAKEKGVSRYGPGVTAGADNYKEGIAPYIDTIRSIVLPKRGARGDPANFERARVIGKALNDKRKAMKG